ncbi:MAG: zf-HC2 domain-containing protein [Myxococcota bacterium]
MESSKIEEETLQMFFDGELPPEEEAAVRRHLEASPDGARELAQWQTIRDGIQAASAEWQGELDSDVLFARIEAEIESTSNVTPLRPHDAAPPVESAPSSRERRVWGGVVAGLAAAAAILLVVLALPDTGGPPEVARGSKVVEVDFGDYAGTVFEVEGGAGQPLSVVWISDEEVAVP